MKVECKTLTDEDLEKLRFIKCNNPWLWKVIDAFPASTVPTNEGNVESKIEDVAT